MNLFEFVRFDSYKNLQKKKKTKKTKHEGPPQNLTPWGRLFKNILTRSKCKIIRNCHEGFETDNLLKSYAFYVIIMLLCSPVHCWKKLCLFIFFVETVIHFWGDSLINRKFRRTTFITDPKFLNSIVYFIET